MNQIVSDATVAVVGGGTMGAGIAQVFASAGNPVRISDPDDRVLASVPERIAAGVELLGLSTGPILSRVTTSRSLEEAVRDADIVIEAAPEELALKQRLFGEFESFCRPDTVLASNTSAIPIGAIASSLRVPGRVLGTHFWNPPYFVPLVEVVQGAATDLAYLRWTMELLEHAGSKPVHVRVDVPGFIGNRMQHALKREAIALVANGVCDAETVDTVARYSFGARLAIVGPLEQADLSGLELTLAIHEGLIADLDRTPGPHPMLVDLVNRGLTGARVGQGFRRWGPGEADTRRNEISEYLACAARRRIAAAAPDAEVVALAGDESEGTNG